MKATDDGTGLAIEEQVAWRQMRLTPLVNERGKEAAMKRPVVLVLFAVFAAAVMNPGGLCAEPESSVNLGIGAASKILPHCTATIFLVEYERMYGPKLTVLGRASGVDYRFDDGTYREDGRPRGVDVGVRYYPSGGMRGFYFGGALGYWKADWTFTEYRGQPSESQGKGDFKGVRADVDIGGRIQTASPRVSILPALHFGRFFSSNACEYTAPASRVGTSCSRESEVTSYAFLAVTVGIAF
jgi:hypothetical protein